MRSLTHTNKKEINGAVLSFLFMTATALAIFVPFVIADKGFFQYCGDFNSQQIPFYYYVNGFLKNTTGQWSWNTDLGGSIINSYSFYLLGSPFFWLSSIFPSAWMPFMMVPLLALKFGVGGFAAYMFLRRYSKTRNAAVIAACLYMCSGFTIYNTFFNHFVDCIALFPFLLWALDGFMYDGKRLAFAIAVAINLINNYFFFAGEIVFLAIYFVVKIIRKDYKLTLSRFWLIAFESLLGVGMGCALLLPAILSLKDNPRTVDLANGFGLLLYDKVQQYFEIFASLLFPPDPPYLPNLFTEGAIKWTSMSAFLPIVGCAGVLAYMRARKKSTFTTVMLICLFMAFVPVLNSSFYALNSSYYARWYYMPILLMCAATMHALEDEDIDLLGGIKTISIVTGAFIVFGLVPKLNDKKWTIGVADEPSKFWLTFLTAILMLLIFYCIVKWHRHGVKFMPIMLSTILAFTVCYSILHISLGKFPQWEGDKNYRSECYVAARSAQLPSGFYRIDAYECYDNIGLWFDKPSLHFFNSTVTPAIMKFYPPLGVKRDVSSKPSADLYALQGVLSSRFMVVPKRKSDEFDEKYAQYGYTQAFSDDTFIYYENDNFIPMGFTYDNYYDIDTLDDISENQRSLMLARGIGLSEEQIKEYEHLFSGKALTDMLSYESYCTDAAVRRQSSAYSFKESGSGFTANIEMPKENLVFFSVPYDGGFTATVNGEKAEVIEVSGGMSAVAAGAGDNEIIFTYKTPGFDIALGITAVSALIFAIYAAISINEKRKRGLNK
ncbi:MAG: YfhO family protein [Oscillospiraceae bacterium]